MKWRVIVNVMLTEDKNSALRNAIYKFLKACGMEPVAKNSRSWEGAAVNPVEATKQLKQVMDYLADPRANGYRGDLDVLSIYIDRANNE